MLGDNDVARVDARCRQDHVPAVLALCDLGLLAEPQLVRFLHSKLMVPAVPSDLLGHLEASTIASVPAALAWRHLVVPVSTDEVGNLTLAMADPTDLLAVEAVTAFTRSYLIRAVAPLSALVAALETYYGPDPTGRFSPALASSTPPSPAADPALEPEHASPIAAEPPPPVNILDHLAIAQDRDAVTTTLLDFLESGFERVMLFVHTQNQLRGRDARGDDLLLEAVTQVRIPTTGASLFADIIESGAPYFGLWATDRPIDRMFARAMGGVRGDTLLLPIVLQGKVPLLVFATGTRASWDPKLLGELSSAAGQALERVIQRRKSAASGPEPSAGAD